MGMGNIGIGVGNMGKGWGRRTWERGGREEYGGWGWEHEKGEGGYGDEGGEHGKGNSDMGRRIWGRGTQG